MSAQLGAEGLPEPAGHPAGGLLDLRRGQGALAGAQAQAQAHRLFALGHLPAAVLVHHLHPADQRRGLAGQGRDSLALHAADLAGRGQPERLAGENYRRNLALHGLAASYAELGRIEKALEVIALIPDTSRWNRMVDGTLTPVVRAFARSGERHRALAGRWAPP